MKDWLIENKAAAFLGILTVIVALFMATLSGCDLRKMIDLDVPPAVAQSIDPAGALPGPGVDPKYYTLADADRVVEDWKRFVDIAKEKEDSYNAGMKKAQAQLLDMLTKARNPGDDPNKQV